MTAHATNLSILRTVGVWVFHFDLVNFIDGQYLKTGVDALHRLRKFQHKARDAFDLTGHEHSYIMTAADNVWVRVSQKEPGLPSLLIDFAGRVMTSAEDEGFTQYFGAITRGDHTYDARDRMLIARENFEDLSEQHIDLISEPHIRAAMAEKWSASGAGPTNCVWVSIEAIAPSTVQAECSYPGSTCVTFGDVFDLKAHMRKGVAWPFQESLFQAIRPAAMVEGDAGKGIA
jgi:hypothetical protein